MLTTNVKNHFKSLINPFGNRGIAQNLQPYIMPPCGEHPNSLWMAVVHLTRLDLSLNFTLLELWISLIKNYQHPLVIPKKDFWTTKIHLISYFHIFGQKPNHTLLLPSFYVIISIYLYNFCFLQIQLNIAMEKITNMETTIQVIILVLKHCFSILGKKCTIGYLSIL